MTGFKIEVGKAYRTRCGSKALIRNIRNGASSYPVEGIIDGEGRSWSLRGENLIGSERRIDLIAPWDEPAEPEKPALEPEKYYVFTLGSPLKGFWSDRAEAEGAAKKLAAEKAPHKVFVFSLVSAYRAITTVEAVEP